MLVKEELKQLGIHNAIIKLGEVEIDEDFSYEQQQLLKKNIKKSGLELLDDNNSILIERIKIVVIEMIHYADALPKVNYSIYISDKIGYDYTYLSNIFSKTKGITLQNFIIYHRIEKAKELIIYDELNLSEISSRLQYSSVGHLSNQFKKVTGLTPSVFKNLTMSRRKHLETI
jgi:AraC-like DNA-binding protein